MRTKWFVLLFAALVAIALWGCGSNGGSGGSDVGDPADVDSVGIQNCAVCHEAIYNAWNGETNRHNNYVTDRDPRPDNSSVSGREECEVCHDPTGDSAKVLPIRPVVGCEGCHGGGSAHRGVGPIPYPYPDPVQCAACHDSHFSAQSNIGTAVLASTHNNSDDLHASRAKCQRCHTKEGSLAFSGYTGDKDVMNTMDPVDPDDPETSENDNVTPFNEDDLNPVTCTACHDSHDGSLRANSFIVNDNDLAMGDWDPNNNKTPDQFDFCTSCHTYFNRDGTIIGSGSVASGTAPHYHNTAWYRVIPTTHADNPKTGLGLEPNILEGYTIRFLSDNPCFDCHGHELRTNTRHAQDEPEADDNPADYGSTIFTDWASSRHGANILQTKYAADDGTRSQATVDAVMMAGREDEVGEGWSWTHYDWDDTTGAGPATTRGRGSCQRCHTSTGTSNYMDDPANYDFANNDFGHLEGWTDNGWSGQNEMLYCWGCHENAGAGELREPGAIVEDYGGDNVKVQYPDIINSNTCMTCHIGREIGQNVQVSESKFNDTSFINSHYLAAGASVFAVSGFEYIDMDYNNVSFYAHDSIGTVYEVNTVGSNLPLTDDDMGPCVGCHMTSEEGSHNYLPYELNADGSFAYITPVCAECHNGDFALTAEDIETEEKEYEASLETLAASLSELGIFYDPANYPYFFESNGDDVRDWIRPSYPDQNDQQAGKNTMGAAFNLNLGDHDPGGFAHNRFYYKRLIWDAIDWVHDYKMNGSVPEAVSALEASGAISAEVAAATRDYLGDTRPGSGIENRDPIPGLDPVTNF